MISISPKKFNLPANRAHPRLFGEKTTSITKTNFRI